LDGRRKANGGEEAFGEDLARNPAAGISGEWVFSQNRFESNHLGRLLHTPSDRHEIRPPAKCGPMDNPAGAVAGEAFVVGRRARKWASAGVLEGRYWLCG